MTGRNMLQTTTKKLNQIAFQIDILADTDNPKVKAIAEQVQGLLKEITISEWTASHAKADKFNPLDICKLMNAPEVCRQYGIHYNGGHRRITDNYMLIDDVFTDYPAEFEGQTIKPDGTCQENNSYVDTESVFASINISKYIPVKIDTDLLKQARALKKEFVKIGKAVYNTKRTTIMESYARYKGEKPIIWQDPDMPDWAAGMMTFEDGSRAVILPVREPSENSVMAKKINEKEEQS
jgi:hypothetical protein